MVAETMRFPVFGLLKACLYLRLPGHSRTADEVKVIDVHTLFVG